MKTLKTSVIVLLLLNCLTSYSQPAGNTYLKKYAGSYYMLADGQKASVKTDQYVFTPDGKCTWTFYSNNQNGNQSSTPTKKSGTWKAGEGLIQMFFDMDDGEGSELMSDFKLKDGVFRSEGVFLKKIVTTTAPKQEAKPKTAATTTKPKN